MVLELLLDVGRLRFVERQRQEAQQRELGGLVAARRQDLGMREVEALEQPDAEVARLVRSDCTRSHACDPWTDTRSACDRVESLWTPWSDTRPGGAGLCCVCEVPRSHGPWPHGLRYNGCTTVVAFASQCSEHFAQGLCCSTTRHWFFSNTASPICIFFL